MKATLERQRLNGALRKISVAVGTTAPMRMEVSSGRIGLAAVGQDSIMHISLDAEVETPCLADAMLRRVLSVVKSLPKGQVTMEANGRGTLLSAGNAEVLSADPPEPCDAGLPLMALPGQRIDGELLRSALSGANCDWSPPTPSAWR